MGVKKQSFYKGVIIIMLSQIIIKLLGFIYRIILTNLKQFGDIGNSYYGSGYTVYTLILAISTMGIPNTISKLVSEKIAVGDNRGAYKIFKVALGLFSFIATIFALILFFGAKYIATNILANPGVEYVMMALAPAIIFVAMSAVFRGYFVGMQNMSEYSKAQIIEQIVNSLCSVIFVMMLVGKSPEIMAAGSTLATTFSAFVAFLYLYWYYVKNRKEIIKDIIYSRKVCTESVRKIIKKLISYVIPISFGSVVVSLSSVIDTITVINGLQKFGLKITEANEQFGVLVGKVDILIAVPLSLNVAFSVALVPFISGAIAKGRKLEAVKKIEDSLKISMLIALPCTFGLFFMAQEIFNFIFPNASNGAYLLKIQCLMIIFSVCAQTLYGALQGIGKLKIPGICLLLGATIKYLLNVVFVPIYGIKVAALSSVIYHFIAFALSFIILFSSLKVIPNLKEFIFKPCMATGCMSIIVLLLKKYLLKLHISNSIYTILVIFIAVISYCIFVFMFRCLKLSDIARLRYGNKICKVTDKT